jgi:hypothetical protein
MCCCAPLQGIFVGEMSVNGLVKGSAWDQGNTTVEATAIADKFWEIYTARSVTYSDIE